MVLKPTPPHDAKNRFLKDKQPGVTKKALENYRTTLRQFCDWLDGQHVRDCNEFDSEVIQRYKEHRLSQVKVITARQDMMTSKQFIEFCEHIAAVPRGMAEMVRIPQTSTDDEICDDLLTRDEALERFDTEMNRIVDDEDGEWLSETTGEGQMVFGGWQLDDLAAAFDPDEELEEDAETPETDPEVEENPVYDAVESFVNTIEFSIDDGEMDDIEARFSRQYPGDSVPSEAEVEEYLIGERAVPHEIGVTENRVHASASFDAIDQ